MRLAWLGAGASFMVILAASGCEADSSREPASRPEGPTAVASQAIQDGVLDTTHKFAVGVCDGQPKQCFGVCSGALILPNVVATARHCVDDTPERIDCSKNPTFGKRKNVPINVTTNPSMFEGSGTSGWYGVKGIGVPDDDHICGNDIALLVLDESIPAAVTAPITPGVQYLMWDSSQYGSTFNAIGYGKTAPSAENSAGTRRLRKFVKVLCTPGSDTRPCPAQLGLSPNEFVGGDGTCSGDSGSSAYEANTFFTGTPVSFGVLSRGGESDDKTKCIGSIYTRFDAHRDFVLNVAKVASNDWTLYPEPSWTEYKPPPSPKSKDAGKDEEEEETPEEPAGAELGEECEADGDCASGTCADAGDGSLVCSESCDESEEEACTEGYECRDSLCLPPLPEAPKKTKTTTTTCTAAAPGAGGSGALLAVLGAALLAAGRRRTRR